MTIRSSMRRSLALAATVSVFALASPALADCDVITTTNPGDTLACTVTTTTDTTTGSALERRLTPHELSLRRIDVHVGVIKRP